jgi:hypothetical protein
LPDLPTLKETKNKKGDAILSWGNKLRKIEIQSLVPLMGVKAALEQDLVFQILEALGGTLTNNAC